MMQDWVDRVEVRLLDVRQRLDRATERSGRGSGAVRIVAITKGHPVEAIQAAVALGLDQIGENRVDEALGKQEQVRELGISWHMVGHIQSRKAADVPGHFDWVHSVDRMKIAQRLDRFAQEAGERLPVFLECNVSGEGSKGGWACVRQEDWPAVATEFKEIVSLPGLRVAGLMTMAPWVTDEDVLRSCFKNLRLLRDFITDTLGTELPHLSMGMTDDYEIAVEEGATMVRLGRALFGEREG